MFAKSKVQELNHHMDQVHESDTKLMWSRSTYKSRGSVWFSLFPITEQNTSSFVLRLISQYHAKINKIDVKSLDFIAACIISHNTQDFIGICS